jgi:small-conductance mechanosensitive channel
MTFATTDNSWWAENWPTLVIVACVIVALVVIDRVMAAKGRAWAARLPAADQAMLLTRYRLLRRVILAVVAFLGVMAVLLSFDATRSWAQAVVASSTVLGLVIGFAARSTLANFVAGVMIALNQPVRLGDRTQIGDIEGIVEDIGLTYTRLRTPDNRRVLIPNEELAGGRVVNLTAIDPVSLAQVRVWVPLSADHDRVREALAELVPPAPGRVGDRPDPGVSVAELTETSAVFSIGVWVSDPQQALRTSAWLRERALTRLAGEGIFQGVGAEVGG